MRFNFYGKQSVKISKMSGNSYSPMSEDKMLAYIYEDVDDSDIFALETINNSFTEIDAKDEQNIEPIDGKTPDKEEHENLKEMLRKLQIEKDQLELRISEVYKTARTELERKDRRLQELNEEKNAILFRRNRGSRNKQGNNDSYVDKGLTKEEFQRFDPRNKIPKRTNLDNGDSFQVTKKTEVLANLNEVVNTHNDKELTKEKFQRFDDRSKIPNSTHFDNGGSFQVNKETKVLVKLNEVVNSQNNKELTNEEFQRINAKSEIPKSTNLDNDGNFQVNEEPKVLAKLNEEVDSHKNKDLTNEEFQRFDARYKIPKRTNLDDDDSFQINKETEVLSQLNEVVNSHYNRAQNCRKIPQYNKDTKSDRHKGANSRDKPESSEHNRGKPHDIVWGQKHNTPNRRKSVGLDTGNCSPSSREVPKIGTQEVCNTPSRFKNRSESQQTRSPRTPPGSPPRVCQQGVSRRRSRSLFQEKRGSSFDERNERCRSVENKECEEEIGFKRRGETGSRQSRPPRTPSGSPPRESVQESRRSRSLFREKRGSSFNERNERSRSVKSKECEEEIAYKRRGETGSRQSRPPRTPSGSPPRESLQESRRSRSLSIEKDSRDVTGRRSRSRSKQEVQKTNAVKREEVGRDKYHQRRKRTVSEEVDLRSKEIKKHSDKDKLVQHTRTRSRSPSSLQKNSREKDHDTFRKDKDSFSMRKDKDRMSRSSSRDKDRKDHTQKQINHNGNKQNEKKQSQADNKSKEVGTSNSRPFRSQSCEKGNRGRNIRSRSRSKERNLRKSPQRHRYRRDQGRTRNPKHVGRTRQSTSSEWDTGRRNRYGNTIRPSCREWKSRNRYIGPNINRPFRNRGGNSRPRDIGKLREQIFRYSMEKDVLKRNMDKRMLLKENETDYSDLDDLRLHLSGASDEISSIEDTKERKDDYLKSDFDEGFELVKDCPDVLKMSDFELERLLEGRLKELRDGRVDSVPEMSEENDVLTDFEEGHLTETEELEDLEKPMNMNAISVVDKQISFQDSLAENRELSEGNNRNELTVEVEDTLTFKKLNTHRNDGVSHTYGENWDQPGEKCLNEKIQVVITHDADDSTQRNANNANNQFRTVFEARKHKKLIKKDLRKKIDGITRSKQEQLAKKGNAEKPNTQSRSEDTKEQQEKPQFLYTKSMTKSETNTKQIDDTDTGKENENTLPKRSVGKPYSGLIEKVQEMNLSFGPPKNKEKYVGKLQNCKVNTENIVNAAELKEESSYRDPRQSLSLKDIRECLSDVTKTKKNTKKKIDLDSYKKRKKIGVNVTPDLLEESRNVNNEEQASKCTNEVVDECTIEHNQVLDNDNAEPNPEKDPNCNTDHPDKSNETVKGNHQISVESSEKYLSHGDVKPKDPFIGKNTEGVVDTNIQFENLNSPTNKEEESGYNKQISDNQQGDLVAYSHIAVIENDSEANHVSSFLHDFSMSEDEDCFQNNGSPRNVDIIDDTAAKHKKENKINILDITIVKRNPLAMQATAQFVETKNMPKYVLVASSDWKAQNNVQEASECIEQIQEAVQSNRVEIEHSGHISSNTDCAVQKLDRDELQKCLEDDESEPKYDEHIQHERAKKTIPAGRKKKTKGDGKKKKNTTKGKQNKGQLIDVSEEMATEKDTYHERLMLCFGMMTPSPCKPPSPVDSIKSKWNKLQVEKVKRNLTAEPVSENIVGGVKTQNQREIKAKKKTLRSKSVDDTLFRNVLRKQKDLEEICTEDQSTSLNSKQTEHDKMQVNYLNFCNNPNYIPNPEVKKAFDSPNRYINKKCTEYMQKREIEENNDLKEPANTIEENHGEDKIDEKKNSKKPKQISEKEVLQANRESTRKTSEVVKTEKKKRSKNTCIKIKMFPNQSKKRKGSNNSGDSKRGKRKKLHSSSGEDQISFSDETNSENESIEKPKNEKRPQKNKSTKSSTIKSKRNSKGKQSKKGECTTKEVTDSVKDSQTASSPFEITNCLIAEETTKPDTTTPASTPKTHRNGCKTNEKQKELGKCEQIVIEEHCTETEMVTKKGLRIRKPVRHYQSRATGNEAITKKKSPRRITPVKIGEVSEISKIQLTIQSTQSAQSSKRKLNDTTEERRPQKLQRRNDSEAFEKPDQSPLPHMEQMLKHLERKTSDGYEHPVGHEQLYAANPEFQSCDINADPPCVTVPNSISPTKHDHSVPEITLDTKDVAMLGTLERGIYDNMTKYLGDKSFPSLETMDKTKEDNSGTSNVGQQGQETVTQLDFSNCLSKHVNTSTPIKKAEALSKANKSQTQNLMNPHMAGNVGSNDVAHSVSSVSTASNNVSNLTKSYLLAPLKRDRRRRVRIVMVDTT